MGRTACTRVHFTFSLFTARNEEHTDLCSSLDSDYGNVTVCCAQKLLTLNEANLKFSTDVILRVLTLLFGNKSRKNLNI